MIPSKEKTIFIGWWIFKAKKMTIDEVKETEWYKERPQIIKDAIEVLPPIRLYKTPEGKQCYLYSYSEPDSGKLEDVTVRVHFTGVGGPLAGTGLEVLDFGSGVFGYKLSDLTPWDADKTGS